MEEVPLFFMCPISMELMQDPVTISTGVTYERMHIHKWFHVYNKSTCPATMQRLDTFGLTPNHTLKRLIDSWRSAEQLSRQSSPSSSSPPSPLRSGCDEEITFLLSRIESSPFKSTSLKKLKVLMQAQDDEITHEFMKHGGIELMGHTIFQILIDASDFNAYRACEDALALLYNLPLTDKASVQLLAKPEFLDAMAVLLQRGGAEARLHAIAIMRKMVKNESKNILSERGVDLYKSLLELLSDEICNRASSFALDVLIEITLNKKNQLKAIDAGAIYTLIELLPEANRHKCEKMLFLLKLLCSSPEGRCAFCEHPMGIPAVSKKILRVSEVATKLGVKIMWSICSLHSTDRVLEDLLVFGSVKKLLGLLHVNGRTSTKDKAMKIIKMYGRSWSKCPCFPDELRDCLRLVQETR